MAMSTSPAGVARSGRGKDVQLLRVAIVGAGLMGRWHAHAARHAGAQVAAIVDRDAARAKALAARYPGCRSGTRLDESLDAVDAVHVCTPTAAHGPLAREALNGGRHVLVEKPLATTAVETADLLGAAASNGVLLCPVHQFLFQDGVERALVRLLAIAPLRHVAITICSAGADAADSATRDAIAADILPHPLSLLGRVLPGTVCDLDWSVRHPAAGEVRALAQGDDVTASLVVSMSGRPTTNRMELVGGGGTIRVDLFHGFAVTLGGTVSRARKVAQPFTEAVVVTAAAAANLVTRAWRREPAYPGLRSLIERFYRAAATGDVCPITPREILDTARACDRLERALAETPVRSTAAPACQ
jgi:predicted dehydrogenase